MVEEERHADERRHSAERDLKRREYRPGHDVGDQDEQCAKERRERHDEAVVNAHDAPRDVRHDESDKADRPRHRHRRPCEDQHGKACPQADARKLSAKPDGHIFSEGEQRHRAGDRYSKEESQDGPGHDA